MAFTKQDVSSFLVKEPLLDPENMRKMAPESRRSLINHVEGLRERLLPLDLFAPIPTDVEVLFREVRAIAGY